jgi:putative ABC transport system substrate-binding protein
MVPNATSLALLINPTSPNLAKVQSSDLQTAARSLGLQLHVLQASADRDFDSVFASVTRLRAGGLVISSDSFFFSQSHQLAALSSLLQGPPDARLGAIRRKPFACLYIQPLQ